MSVAITRLFRDPRSTVPRILIEGGSTLARLTATQSVPRRSMADLSIALTAPNGRKYTQPTGLFIDNEFVKSLSAGDSHITSIDPAYVMACFIQYSKRLSY